MPDVAGGGLSLLGIELLEDRFHGTGGGGPVDRVVLKVGMVVVVGFNVGGTPQSCLLVTGLASGDGRCPHDKSPPLGVGVFMVLVGR